MFDKNNRLESQSSRKRYFYGKQMENLIVKTLEDYGMVFENVSLAMDCYDKIDRYLILDGIKYPVQIKARMGYSGSDLLLDVYEPFYGVDNENTIKGRDYIGEYEYYICLSRDNIYVVDGLRQKQIVKEVLEEWKDNRWQLPVFNSEKHEGVQIRYTEDRSNGRPKILMFINPKIYNKNELKIYEMKENYGKKEK